MSALDELKKKEIRTDLEAAVLSSAYYEAQATGFSGKSQTVYSEKAAKELAEKDAELLALRERVAKLEKVADGLAEIVEYDTGDARHGLQSLAKARLAEYEELKEKK